MEDVIARMYNMTQMQEYVDEKIGDTGETPISERLDSIDEALTNIARATNTIPVFIQMTISSNTLSPINSGEITKIQNALNNNIPIIFKVATSSTHVNIFTSNYNLNSTGTSITDINWIRNIEGGIQITHAYDFLSSFNASVEHKTITFDS